MKTMRFIALTTCIVTLLAGCHEEPTCVASPDFDWTIGLVKFKNIDYQNHIYANFHVGGTQWINDSMLIERRDTLFRVPNHFPLDEELSVDKIPWIDLPEGYCILKMHWSSRFNPTERGVLLKELWSDLPDHLMIPENYGGDIKELEDMSLFDTRNHSSVLEEYPLLEKPIFIKVKSIWRYEADETLRNDSIMRLGIWSTPGIKGFDELKENYTRYDFVFTKTLQMLEGIIADNRLNELIDFDERVRVIDKKHPVWKYMYSIPFPYDEE